MYCTETYHWSQAQFYGIVLSMLLGVSFDRLQELCAHFSSSEQVEIRSAYDYAVHAHRLQKRADGSPYAHHIIAVAEYVAEWGGDRDTIIAALLHDTIEDTDVQKEDIVQHFGEHVAVLVDGITKFTHADLSEDLPLDRRIETLRKLLDVMRLDMRSIIIKLADRLHNIRTLDAIENPAKRRRIAKETLDVYHKIALHLGMRQVRHAFAEYCIPLVYDDGIAALALRDRLYEESLFLEKKIITDLRKNTPVLEQYTISVESRNLDTFYHLWKKYEDGIQHSHAALVSIIVPTEDECYRMLRVLHTLYHPLSGQFRDYIAAPSDAGYQSLHTFVTLPDGQVVEFRLRTAEMARQSSYGITLWLFGSQQIPPTFRWLERSGELDIRTRESSSAFWEALQSDVFSEMTSIILNQQRLSIPKGSTVLDAVYALYGAKAGMVRSVLLRGSVVDLGTILQEDDICIARFGSEDLVDFSWLQMVSTQHARLLIIDVLKKMGKNEKISLGATLLQREMDYFNCGLFTDFSLAQQQELCAFFHCDSFDDMLSLLGEGVLSPKDIVFFLFPEQKKRLLSFDTSKRHAFRVRIRATDHANFDSVFALQELLHDSSVQSKKFAMRRDVKNQCTDITVVGSTDNRLQFADFLNLLDRQLWVSSVHMLLSPLQRFFLIFSSFFAILIVVLDILFFPHYQVWVRHYTSLPFFITIILPILPIFAVNYYLLRLLRHYIVRMRTERWFLGMGLLLNALGLVFIAIRTATSEVSHTSFLPLVGCFAISLIYIGWRFFQADRLLSLPQADTRHHSPLPLRARVLGYVLRFLAIAIWGALPIYIRYTPVALLSPLFRIFLTGIGILLPFTLIHCIHSWMHRKKISFRIPYDYTFGLFVIGQVGFAYLQHVSLLYTTSTNLQLFNGFAPVIGLFIAVLFWRREIPYLRKTQTMLWIFTLTIMASFGSTLLIYSSANFLQPSSIVAVTGDLLAILSTFFDVILTVGQIQYIKTHVKTSSILINIHLFFYFCCFTAPILLLLWLLRGPVFIPSSPTPLLFGLGIGGLVGLGLILNYEALKRIDGYISYMLYNLSIVVTFLLEAFFIRSITPTLHLVLSGVLILGASFIAELINARIDQS